MSDDIIKNFNNLLTKFNEELDEEIFTYSRENIPKLIDEEYSGKWKDYVNDLLNNKVTDDLYIKYSLEIIDSISSPLHIDIVNKINNFTLGDRYSLTISYGFGSSFWQIFPQDPEYANRFFKQSKRNVILGFEPDGAGDNAIFGIGGDIFKVNSITPNSKGYKNKVITMIKTVFKTSEVRVEKIKNLGLLFYFQNYLFIWVNSKLSIPLLCKHYTNILDNSSEKNIICSSYPGCSEDYSKYDFYKKEFVNMIEVMYNKTINESNTSSNIVDFKKSTMVKRVSRNGTKSLEKVWNGLGGKRKTRRLNKYSRKIDNERSRTRRI